MSPGDVRATLERALAEGSSVSVDVRGSAVVVSGVVLALDDRHADLRTHAGEARRLPLALVADARVVPERYAGADLRRVAEEHGS